MFCILHEKGMSSLWHATRFNRKQKYIQVLDERAMTAKNGIFSQIDIHEYLRKYYNYNFPHRRFLISQKFFIYKFRTNDRFYSSSIFVIESKEQTGKCVRHLEVGCIHRGNINLYSIANEPIWNKNTNLMNNKNFQTLLLKLHPAKNQW